MTWHDAARQHAEAAFPREACGLVVVTRGRETFWPCRNTADGNDHFVIEPEDYAAAEDGGEVVGVFHSHCNAGPEPSEADLVACENSGLAWHILGLPVGRWHSWTPCGYQAPLVGRQFQHGVLDCYTLIRDWYRQERGITLPDYGRRDDWWHRGENLYLDNFRDAGFVDNADLHVGAVLLMQVQSPVPNHAAIYVGDDLILHHLQGRLSSRDVYGGYWRKNTVRILRHEGNPALR